MNNFKKFLNANGIVFDENWISKDWGSLRFTINGKRYVAEVSGRRYQLNILRDGSEYFRPIVCNTQKEMVQMLQSVAF